ncbi:GIY-YIG nuclease family protein [Clostridiaceae bacterium HSG29]|nr:GIY-YIG nuclease family protein [Clostridiaceae bacterium HSG29]
MNREIVKFCSKKGMIIIEKTVTYLYPDAKNASNLKMYQDRTNQIKALYFTKESIKEIEKLPSSNSYAVYFLFNNSEIDEKRVYIGQSMNGVRRISEHVKNKEFWTYCIMFVSDNNSFDKLTIDYLEYKFIKKFKKSSYVLINKDLRNQEPNVSIYDKPKLTVFIEQIEFLLNAEGITISEFIADNDELAYYYPSKKYKAKLFVKDGKFILEKESELKRPLESSKTWKNDRHYKRFNKLIDDYIEDEKVIEENGKIIVLINLVFNAPSTPANLITGYSENGWLFFKGLNELRNN